MKKNIVLIIILAVMFIALSASIAFTVFFYKDYGRRNEYFSRQAASLQGKVDSFQEQLSAFKENIAQLAAKFTKYADSLSAVEIKLKSDRATINDISSKITDLENDIKSWQKDYFKALLETTQKIDAIKAGVDLLNKETVANIESEITQIKNQLKSAQIQSSLRVIEKKPTEQPSALPARE